jgi:hypothetical protein
VGEFRGDFAAAFFEEAGDDSDGATYDEVWE